MSNTIIKSLGLLIVMLAMSLPIAAYDFEVNGICYTITSESDKTVEVVSNPDSNYSGTIILPERVEYNGGEYTVTSIGIEAFYACKDLKSVHISNTISWIKDRAFKNCGIINSIYVGTGIRKLSSNSFRDTHVEKVFWLCNTLPEAYYDELWRSASINHYAALDYPFLSSMFSVDGLVYVPVSPSDKTCDVVDCEYSSQSTNLTVPKVVVNKGIQMEVNNIGQKAFCHNEGVVSAQILNSGSIGCGAFEDCINMELISIGPDVRTIGSEVFRNCSSLRSIIIPKGVMTIGDGAFDYCTSLSDVIFEDSQFGEISWPIGVTYLLNDSGPDSSHYSFYVVEGDEISCLIKYSHNGGFNPSYVSLDFLSSSPVGGLNNWYNENLMSKDCAENDSIAFRYVFKKSGLASLRIVSRSSLRIINTDISITGNNNNLYLGKGKCLYDYSESLRSFSPLFEDCSLDDIYVGRKLIYDATPGSGYSPFYRNASLRVVEISDKETQIYDNQFYGCTGLKTLKLGNNIRFIGDFAFSGCSSLDYFSAGYHLESIGKEAFSDCIGLTKFYSYAPLPPLCGDQALDDINKWKCTLMVPNQSADEYKAAAQWKEFFFVDEMETVLVAMINLNAEELELFMGKTFQLEASVLPVNATNQKLLYTSSNPDIVSVDEGGLLTAIKPGETFITVNSADGNATKKCKVRVAEEAGMENVKDDNNLVLTRTVNGYCVNGALGSILEVYSIDGLLLQKYSHYMEDEISLSPGIYIIRMDDHLWKVKF